MKRLIPLSFRKIVGNWWHGWQSRRAKKNLLNHLRGNDLLCNVCSWSGRAFADDHWHLGTVCPNCGSQVRHRLLVAVLDGRSNNHPNLIESRIFQGKEVLHFAPERQLRERIRKASEKHVTADYDRGDCDLKLDMSAMPSVEDSSCDVVIACDVLEHVPDDLAAMRELHRILRPGGMAILSVPQMDSPAKTNQDPGVTTEAERERQFGQKDHVRMYGDDFPERLHSSGFEVIMVTDNDFPKSYSMRHVLAPPFKSSHPLATNCRRIYFCKRPMETNDSVV